MSYIVSTGARRKSAALFDVSHSLSWDCCYCMQYGAYYRGICVGVCFLWRAPAGSTEYVGMMFDSLANARVLWLSMFT